MLLMLQLLATEGGGAFVIIPINAGNGHGCGKFHGMLFRLTVAELIIFKPGETR